MNGAAPQTEQPIITVNQFTLTGKQILTIIGTIVSTVIAGGWWFLPAKQTDVDALAGVVKVMQQQITESRASIERLTTAVDNLSGMVAVRAAPAVPVPRQKGR